ncbi:hypothetical protein OG716_02405 [Nocardia sp. NBC_01388]
MAVAQRRSCETSTSEERSATLVAAWESYIADPEARPEPIRDVFTRPEMSIFDGEYAKEDIPLPAPDPERLRQLGIWLVRNSSDRRPVLAGLSLLAEAGTPEDIPLLRTIGVASCFVRGAVAALGAIPGTAPDLVWLAQHTKSSGRQYVLQGLADASDPVARHWLLRNAGVFSSPGRNDYALHIAQVTGLAAALTEDDRDDQVRDQAIGLLLQMARHDDYGTVIDRYPDAKRTLALVAAETSWMTPTSDRYADLTALVEDLRTGASACLDWANDEREAVLDRLLAVLRSPAWIRTLTVSADSDPYFAWRARWARNIVDARYEADAPRHFWRPCTGVRNRSGRAVRKMRISHWMIRLWSPSGTALAPSFPLTNSSRTPSAIRSAARASSSNSSIVMSDSCTAVISSRYGALSACDGQARRCDQGIAAASASRGSESSSCRVAECE